MRMRLVAVLALALGMVSLGCDNNKKQVQMAEPPSPQPVSAPLAPIAAGDTGTSTATKTPPPLVSPTTPKKEVTTDAAPGQPGKNYTIKKGDTFVSIARAVDHDPKRAKDIQAANPTVDPSKMPVGTVIKLPK
jgi:nucleoid-associated protein YgaU